MNKQNEKLSRIEKVGYDSDKYYVIAVECYNCFGGNRTFGELTSSYEMEIPKGIKVGTFLKKQVCESCGCKTIRRVNR